MRSPLILHRRHFLIATALLELNACAATTTGKVTTVTLDTETIILDAQAGISALQLIMAIPGVAVLAGPYAPLISGLLVSAQAVVTQIAQTTGGKPVTLAADITSVQTMITTLVNDANKVIDLLAPVIPQLVSNDLTNARAYLTAANTLIVTVKTLAQLSSITVGSTLTQTGMSELEARHLIESAKR